MNQIQKQTTRPDFTTNTAGTGNPKLQPKPGKNNITNSILFLRSTNNLGFMVQQKVCVKYSKPDATSAD